jgi:histidinol-phosphate/aromatic aminotransferase/cobyric acid decarboxylase-like protein/adenosyl cobinamide kinase/adenosyl cobinamide phosphate guanylyltransferase
MSLALVIGGTRSGKSAHAERLASAAGRAVRYVATADGSDPSMTERVGAHRARRPAEWETVEAGDDLAAAVAGGECVLVDGLGAWIAGVLHRAGAFADDAAPDVLDAAGAHVRGQIDALLEAARGADVIVVAEDAGGGVLPAGRAARTWLDLLGEVTQRLAAAAGRADLVVAGRAIPLPAPADALRGDDARAAPDRAGTAARPAGPELLALRRHGDTDVRPGDADHAVNVVSGGLQPWLREALDAALDGAAGRYPDESAAVAALAARHGRDPAEIVPTNGAAEALWLMPPALRPGLAACVHPGFTEAEAALRAHGVPVARVLRDPDASFALDPAAVPEAADLVVVGNPASPSGTLDPATAILALRRPGRVVVVDEAFMDMVPGRTPSLAGERLDDVIVVRSLTKVLAVPGLRVGYAVAGPALAARLRAARPPWSANALALAALEAAASRPEELAAIAERVAAERDDLAGRLRAIAGVRTWPSVANFCLIEVDDGEQVAARLRARGIAVRPAASFPGLDARHVRVTARDPAANERLAAALAEAVAG